MPGILPLTILYVILAALTVMNMLIGVLCEAVSAVADKEKDDIKQEILIDKMRSIVEHLDTNDDNQVSYGEFIQIMAMPNAYFQIEY